MFAMLIWLKSFIVYHFDLIRYHCRDYGLKVSRSSQWSHVEKSFKAAHPTCAACDGTDKIQVHHVMPFHLDPSLELDITNLISLCMSHPNECHLKIAHSGDFKAWNPNVREDASAVLNNPSIYNEIVAVAKSNRRYK